MLHAHTRDSGPNGSEGDYLSGKFFTIESLSNYEDDDLDDSLLHSRFWCRHATLVCGEERYVTTLKTAV